MNIIDRIKGLCNKKIPGFKSIDIDIFLNKPSNYFVLRLFLQIIGNADQMAHVTSAPVTFRSATVNKLQNQRQ